MTLNDPSTSETPEIPSPCATRLSEQLEMLVKHFAEKPVCLEEVVTVLHGRAYFFLLILLALPFCTPVPLPGVSTPFGFVIALIGLRLALGQKPWLPRRLLATRLPPHFFSNLFKVAQKIFKKMERLLKPRWEFLIKNGLMRCFYGLIVLVCGTFLLLPLPIPFSNFFPAVTIVLISFALLESDGYFATVALGIFIITLIFFGLLLLGGIDLLNWFKK